MILKNKFAIGCLVQWYEIDLIGEYIESLKQSLKEIENKENVHIDFVFTVNQDLERIDDTTTMEDIGERFDEMINELKTITPFVRVEPTAKLVTVADYRREFNSAWCEVVDVLMWGETDSLIPKQTFQILDNLHDGVKEQTPKYVGFFGTCKMWDESWKPIEHSKFTDKPFIEDGYDDQGVIQYQDLNNDGEVTNEDQTILGGPYPDFIYALNSTLNYKSLSLNLFFEGSEGNELSWATGGYIANSFSTGGNQIVDVYNDYWTPQNTDAAYPAPSENRAQLRTSDRFVKDASYLRLKNVKLAYNIPVQSIKPALAALQVYISAQNVFTVTDFPGLDPDVNTRGGTGDLRIGIAQTSYPSSRTITLGMNLKL